MCLTIYNTFERKIQEGILTFRRKKKMMYCVY